MNRALLVPLTLCLLLTAGVGAAAADTGAPGSLRIESVATDEHPRMTATFVAPRELADHTLTDGDVTVAEGGQLRDATVTSLPGESQELVVVMDTSGSMAGDALRAAKEAANDLVARVPDGARVALVGFDARPDVVVPFTDDTARLSTAIGGLEAGGNTALYDAVATASRLFAEGQAEHRTVILLTDGADTASGTDRAGAGRTLATVGASFVGVELGTAATDRNTLDEVAASVDGVVVTADGPDALGDVYDAVATDIGNRYTVEYRSGAFGPTDLEIAVSARGTTQRVGGYLVQLPAAPVWHGLLASPAGLLGGLVLCYLALAAVILAVSGRKMDLRSRLIRTVGQPTRDGALAGWADRAAGAAGAGLQRRGLDARLASALRDAGLSHPPGEFAVICAGGALALGAVGVLLGGPVLGTFLAGASLLAVRGVLGVLAGRRRTAFADQLDDTLQLLSGSLRAGHSLLQALDAVAGEADAPTSEEFRRVVNETRLGRPLVGALDDVAERMCSDDFLWVSQAIAIHREVGGDLAEVLDTVGGTIRERNQLRRQVKALSAEGKLSAVILLALPFVVLFFLSMTSPGYLSTLTTDLLGVALLAIGGVMLTAGALWLRKIVRITF